VWVYDCFADFKLHAGDYLSETTILPQGDLITKG